MKFRPMGVDQAGWNFGLNKLNRELDRHQFIRELTQNAIEAVQQTDGSTGDVTWDLYPMEINGKTVNKLCCIDNGIGMTGPELVDYINTGFKSGKEQGHKANFGIGAKVSALAFNKAGILYMSWKDGAGAMIHLSQDPITGFYGLNQRRRFDGTYGWWAEISDEVKPDLIKQHGTMVILLGDTEDQDTFERPENSDLPPSRWVGTYLQRKYVKFPEGITVRAREQRLQVDAYKNTSTSHRVIRKLKGQSSVLDEHSVDKGEVVLKGARAHYWLLDPALFDKKGGDPRIYPSSHVAALYKDELHEVLMASKGAPRRLSSFGIFTGQSRVVLYVEPDPEHVEATLTRQQLLVDGERFPWDEYAAGFSENMPESISRMMEELLAKADSRTNYEKVKERLKELKQWLDRMNRYRPADDGSVTAEMPVPGGDPGVGPPQPGPTSTGGFPSGVVDHIDRLLQSPKGARARPRKTNHQPPEVVWLSRHEGTRDRGFLEDRAAMYDPNTNRITANKDFRTFKSVSKAVSKLSPSLTGFGERIAMLEFETVLVETVMNILVMEGSEQWSSEEVQQQFTPEAMTNCVNHTFHIVKAAEAEVRLQKIEANKKAIEENKKTRVA